MTRQDRKEGFSNSPSQFIGNTPECEKSCVKVLIGKTAADNDQLSLKYGKPDEAFTGQLVVQFVSPEIC